MKTHREKRNSCDHKSRDEIDKATNQEVVRIIGGHQKLGEKQGSILLWILDSEPGLASTLILDFWLPEL